MNINPLAARIALPYARAFFDFSINQHIMHKITDDFQNLEVLLKENPEFIEYLNNPLLSHEAKRSILEKTLKLEIDPETLKFLFLLVNKNRINVLSSVITVYLKLVYEIASIKRIKVSTAFPFINSQKRTLIQKLKKLTNASKIILDVDLEPSLIGGFLIQTESKVIDFSIKSQLQKLAQHLDSVLEM